MCAFTERTDLLFVSSDESAHAQRVVENLQDEGWSVSSVTPQDCRDSLSRELPDCLLLSETLGTETMVEMVHTVRRTAPAVPVVAFVDDEDRSVEQLFDAGLTDIIRGKSADVSPRVLERRLEAARAMAGAPPAGVGDDESPQEEATETSIDVVWVNSLDEDGLSHVTDAYEEVWGRPREPLYEDRERLLETVHPADRTRVQEAMEQQLEVPEAYDLTYRIVRPDGEHRWVHSRAVGVRDNGELQRIVGVATDVTERKHTGRQLAAERQKRLEAQRDELALLNHINQVVRGVDQALLDAETREQVFEATCDELAASDRYQFAVALQVVGERRLEATAFTDGAAGFVDEVYPLEFDSLSDSTSGRALATNETQVVPRIHDNDRVSEELEAAFQDAGVQSLAVVPVQYGDVQYGTVAVYSPKEDAFGEKERAVFDELGETVGHAIAALESRQRERTLTSLYEATDEFLTAETPQDISDVAVETASQVLDLPGIGIFLFDDETNLLAPEAGTETFLEFFGESPAFGPGKEDSITWHTYVTGEPRCFADVRESDRLAHPETSARASLLIPLGEHGVFVAASRDTGVFTEQKRQLVGLLAATTEAALDRVAGEADIRERDAALEERTRQLERLEGLLSVSQDITALIRDAKTRTTLEEGLCERLVEVECIAFAWVGYRPSDSEELEPRTWAGSEDGYLDAISLQPGGDEPALETTLSGETTAIANVTSHIRERSWAREAIDRGYQSVLAVPLADGETDYGVLAVYSTEPETVTETVEAVAGEFGATIAYGINSVETRRGILGDGATEIDVHLGATDTLLNAVAATVGEPVSYREMAPLDGETTQILFQLSEPPVEEILALESEFVTVESLTHTRRGETHLFRATVSGESVATELLDCGGIPQEVTATPTETRATLRLSQELTVREFLDRLRDYYPGAELLSRHDPDNVRGSRSPIRQALDEQLTDRQREVLVTAYESGFFQSPRDTTGEELAELLDISQPTVTHHLREAQHRLFSALLDES